MSAGLYPSFPRPSLTSSGKKKDSALRTSPPLPTHANIAGPRRHSSLWQLIFFLNRWRSRLPALWTTRRLGRRCLIHRYLLFEQECCHFLGDQDRHRFALCQRDEFFFALVLKHPPIGRIRSLQPPFPPRL